MLFNKYSNLNRKNRGGDRIKIRDPDHMLTQPLESNSFRVSQSLSGINLGYLRLI